MYSSQLRRQGSGEYEIPDSGGAVVKPGTMEMEPEPETETETETEMEMEMEMQVCNGSSLVPLSPFSNS